MIFLEASSKNILKEINNTETSKDVNVLDVETLKIDTTVSLSFDIDTEESTSTVFKDYKSFTDSVEGKVTKQKEPQFNPYEDNSGTAVAIKLNDLIIVAADTRRCSEMGIYSRNTPKIYYIGDYLVTITGFYADGIELINILKYQVLLYESFNKISIHSLANLASKVMYSKRLFPYYSYVTLSGFCDGEPFVYSFDCLGHFEKVSTVCNGSGASFIQPLLDSLIEKKNWIGESPVVDEEYTKSVVRKAFDAASERDVKTGDYLEMYVVRENGAVKSVEKLRQD